MTTTDVVLRCHRHPKYTGVRMYRRYKPSLPPGFDDPDCVGCDAIYAARHSGGWRETRRRVSKEINRRLAEAYTIREADEGPSYITSPGT